MTDRPAQRTPNRQLATLIAEAGFSNAGLARRVDQLGLEHGLDLRYDKTSVTRWLRGQQPRGTTPALIAEVFTRRLGRRLTAQDLGLDACAPVYAGLEFAATPEEAVDIVGGLWRKDSGSHAELRKIAFTPAGLVVPSRDWLIGRPDDKVAREALARVPAQVRPGAESAVPVPGRPAGRAEDRFAPVAAPVPPRPRGHAERVPGHRVSGGDIAALRSVGELFRTLDDQYGGGHARQALVRYLEHECEPMLRGVYGEQTGRRLFAAAADLTRLAGWTSYDIAAHGLAQRYFVQALRLAQAAGDRAYGSYVLVTMSRQAVYLGHGREAVQLTRVAQQGSAPARRRSCRRCCTPPRRGRTASSVRCGRARAHWCGPSARWRRPGPGTTCRTGRTSSTRHSSPTSWGTATGTSSSTAPPPSTRNARCSCAPPSTPAAASSAASSSPPPASASANSTRPAPSPRRRPPRPSRCARSAPSSTSRTSNAAWSPTRTRPPHAATATRWPHWADRRPPTADR